MNTVKIIIEDSCSKNKLNLNNTVRTCKKCNVEKVLEDFSKSKVCKFGRCHECKICKNIRRNNEAIQPKSKPCSFCELEIPIRKISVDINKIQICYDCQIDKSIVKCSTCQIFQSTTYFHKNKYNRTKVSNECKNCDTNRRNNDDSRNQRQRKRRASRANENWPYIINYLLKNPCVHCGQTNVQVLEFDHLDPKTKKYVIGGMMSNQSLSVIKKEIKKCQILCRNCHRIKTTSQFTNSWRLDAIAGNVKLNKTRMWYYNYLKEHPCELCGETNILVLEADHIDPFLKKDKISSLLNIKSFEQLKKEIEKCRILCGNCHKKHTNNTTQPYRKVWFDKINAEVI